MVERPADVLLMDPGKPVRQAWHFRLDAAIRKTPGLGVFIAFVVLDNLWARGNVIAFAIFAVCIAGALATEFLPERTE